MAKRPAPRPVVAIAIAIAIAIAGTGTGTGAIAGAGGGLSGAATARHLLGLARGALGIVVAEPGADPGRGLACSTTRNRCCLNVPAGRLGLDPAHESDFVGQRHSRGHAYAASSFLPRRLPGACVGEALSRRPSDRATCGHAPRRSRPTAAAWH